MGVNFYGHACGFDIGSVKSNCLCLRLESLNSKDQELGYFPRFLIH